MKYPDYFCDMKTTFKTLPRSYQEYLIRWYYYECPATDNPRSIPDSNFNMDKSKISYDNVDNKIVKKIEQFIVEQMNSSDMWCAKGFATARSVDKTGDNLDFSNDSEFYIFSLYVARLIFECGVKNNWFDENISKKDFLEHCKPLRGNDIYI